MEKSTTVGETVEVLLAANNKRRSADDTELLQEMPVVTCVWFSLSLIWERVPMAMSQLSNTQC